jgi:hypothetical protein
VGIDSHFFGPELREGGWIDWASWLNFWAVQTIERPFKTEHNGRRMYRSCLRALALFLCVTLIIEPATAVSFSPALPDPVVSEHLPVFENQALLLPLVAETRARATLHQWPKDATLPTIEVPQSGARSATIFDWQAIYQRASELAIESQPIDGRRTRKTTEQRKPKGSTSTLIGMMIGPFLILSIAGGLAFTTSCVSRAALSVPAIGQAQNVDERAVADTREATEAFAKGPNAETLENLRRSLAALERRITRVDITELAPVVKGKNPLKDMKITRDRARKMLENIDQERPLSPTHDAGKHSLIMPVLGTFATLRRKPRSHRPFTLQSA